MAKKREVRQSTRRSWSGALFRLLVALGGIAASAYQFARGLSMEDRTVIGLVIAAVALTLTVWMVLKLLERTSPDESRGDE